MSWINCRTLKMILIRTHRTMRHCWRSWTRATTIGRVKLVSVRMWLSGFLLFLFRSCIRVRSVTHITTLYPFKFTLNNRLFILINNLFCRGLPNGHWWWGETRVWRVYYTEGNFNVNARVKPAIIQFTDVGPVRRISNSEWFFVSLSQYIILIKIRSWKRLCTRLINMRSTFNRRNKDDLSLYHHNYYKILTIISQLCYSSTEKKTWISKKNDQKKS